MQSLLFADWRQSFCFVWLRHFVFMAFRIVIEYIKSGIQLNKCYGMYNQKLERNLFLRKNIYYWNITCKHNIIIIFLSKTKRLSVVIGKRKERGTMEKQKKDRLAERQKMIRKILNVPPSKHFKRVIALASSIATKCVC